MTATTPPCPEVHQPDASGRPNQGTHANMGSSRLDSRSLQRGERPTSVRTRLTDHRKIFPSGPGPFQAHARQGLSVGVTMRERGRAGLVVPFVIAGHDSQRDRANLDGPTAVDPTGDPRHASPEKPFPTSQIHREESALDELQVGVTDFNARMIDDQVRSPVLGRPARRGVANSRLVSSPVSASRHESTSGPIAPHASRKRSLVARS